MQAETAAVVIAVSITVGIAAALDILQDLRVDVLILVIAGHIIGRSTDLTDLPIDLFLRNRNNFGAGNHGQTHLTGGIELTGEHIHLSPQGIAHGHRRNSILEGHAIHIGFQIGKDPGIADHEGSDHLTAVSMDLFCQGRDPADATEGVDLVPRA